MTLFTGIGAVIPTAAVDVVAIFSEIPDGSDPGFLDTVSSIFLGTNVVQENQLISDARPMRASIQEASEFFQHPLETSKYVTDHKIITPVEISITMILTGETYRDTYAQIKQLFLDSTPLVVQTKTDIYTNQIIQSIPHEEDPELFDGISLTFNTREIQFASTEVAFAPFDQTEQGTVERGQQQPVQAQESRASIAFDLYERFF